MLLTYIKVTYTQTKIKHIEKEKITNKIHISQVRMVTQRDMMHGNRGGEKRNRNKNAFFLDPPQV